MKMGQTETWMVFKGSIFSITGGKGHYLALIHK